MASSKYNKVECLVQYKDVENYWCDMAGVCETEEQAKELKKTHIANHPKFEFQAIKRTTTIKDEVIE